MSVGGLIEKLRRLVGLNTTRLDDQETRLQRLENDFEVLRRETEAIKAFEQSRVRAAQGHQR